MRKPIGMAVGQSQFKVIIWTGNGVVKHNIISSIGNNTKSPRFRIINEMEHSTVINSTQFDLFHFACGWAESTAFFRRS